MRLLPRNWSKSYDNSLERRAKRSLHYKEMTDFYGQFVKPGDLCFDIGANLGDRTAVFLDLGARTICVEPQPNCMKKLRKRYGKDKNVILVEAALGATEGFGELAICEEEPTISTMSERWKTEGRFAEKHQWTKTSQVQMTTLDCLISLYGRPAFCKIDVEGFEVFVLKGLTKPLSVISFEFHRELLDNVRVCIDHLLSIGPVKFNISFAESMSFPGQNWVTPDVIYKIFETSNDAFLWGDIYAKFM